MSDIDGFISTPIKLAAMISGFRKASSKQSVAFSNTLPRSLRSGRRSEHRANKSYLNSVSAPLLMLCVLLVRASTTNVQASNHLDAIRHKTHYMNIVPSTHFQHSEGRQSSAQGRSLGQTDGLVRDDVATSGEPMRSHIYKRSSALISSPSLAQGSHYLPLVSSMVQRPMLSALSRRMMSEGANTRWTASGQSASEQQSGYNEDQQLSDLLSSQMIQNNEANNNMDQLVNNQQARTAKNARSSEEAELLLRQKQHIQYHDQWPSMAAKCHKRTLNFCASVLPFNTTTFPNIIGDTNRFEVKRSLPFFGFLAKSSCNKRLDQLLCLLLEPPCSIQSGLAIPPCKKFCRLALEGCNEYIPATLAMSSVFDCRQYPDSNDPSVCINLAQGSKCAEDEFKCPDKTCIPRNWLCDGVRDCIFAADEANCTAVGQQSSVCSTEEFTCDGKCVPKAWKCDGERDCLDGSDEESCDQRPRCGPDRFKCADGNGCLPKRWVCDGKAECRDGSDEMNCEQRDCSESDFKCDNGICIPKLWRCDRQFDCKDGSDERQCVYPTSTTTTTPQPTTLTSTTISEVPTSISFVNASYGSITSTEDSTSSQTSDDASIKKDPSSEQNNKQLESSVIEDVSRIIRHEVGIRVGQQEKLQQVAANESQQQQRQQNGQEMKKFDYDLIQSAPQLNEVLLPSPSENQTNSSNEKSLIKQMDPNQMLTQIDFVQQQQPVRASQEAQELAILKPGGGNQLAVAVAKEQPRLASINDRVPIYRSLFKSLKVGQGRVPIGMVSGQQVVRKRRERYHHQQQQMTTQTMDDFAQQKSAQRTSISPNLASTGEQSNLVSSNNQFVNLSQNHTQARTHGVASYLQLLNNRYNTMRLARMSPSPYVRS